MLSIVCHRTGAISLLCLSLQFSPRLCLQLCIKEGSGKRLIDASERQSLTIFFLFQNLPSTNSSCMSTCCTDNPYRASEFATKFLLLQSKQKIDKFLINLWFSDLFGVSSISEIALPKYDFCYWQCPYSSF